MQKINIKQTFSIKHCHCDTFNRFSRTVNSLNCFSIIIFVSYSHSIYLRTVSSSCLLRLCWTGLNWLIGRLGRATWKESNVLKLSTLAKTELLYLKKCGGIGSNKHPRVLLYSQYKRTLACLVVPSQPLWISSQANLACFGRKGKRDAKSKNAQVGFNWSLEWFSNEILFKWRVKTIHVKVEPNQSTFYFLFTKLRNGVKSYIKYCF